jgi:hypothetical protein
VAATDPEERRRLNELIEAHPARTADYRWTSLLRVHGVMRANEIELLALVQAFEADNAFSLQVMRSDQPQNLQRFLDELIRRTHNYLSSITMLVDHSRNLMRDYSEQPAKAEYDRRVADMVAAGRASVLQRLRNYLIHYRIPPFGLEMQLVPQPGKPSAMVFLDRDAALEYDEWTAPGRKYLEAQPGRIPLRPLIHGYSTDLERLYAWLFARFHELHGDEVNELNDLIERLQGPG